MTRVVRPYGTWPSPVTPERLVAGAVSPGEVRVDGDDIWWSEARPAEGGRVELVRRRIDGATVDVLGPRDAAREPTDGEALDPERRWSARTGLLEYGGGAWCVESGVVVFAQADDQRLHRLVADDPAAVPTPLTPEPRHPGGLRYGDVVAWDRGWVIAVRESHPGEEGLPADAPEPRHEIVAVPTDGSAATDPSRVRVLASGADFYAFPRPGPARLAWVQWDHPRMPWDGTELHVARLGRRADGGPELRGPAVVVAGGPEESVVQPEWDRDGALWFCSDRSGWWNLNRVADPGGEGPDAEPRPVAPMEAEVGGPRWVAGLRWYAPLADGRALAAVTSGGSTRLVLVGPCGLAAPPGRDDVAAAQPPGDAAGPLVEAGGVAVPGRPADRAPAPARGAASVPVRLELGGSPATVVSQVVAGPGAGQAVVVAASGRAEPTPVLLDLPPTDALAPALTAPPAGPSSPVPAPATGVVVPVAAQPLRPGRDLGLDADVVSVPEPISFPSAGGRTAHAQLYRPASTTSVGPDGTLPPLVVMIHGGPTSAARPQLDLRTQYWTSRGFAVLDVDHGGSTGYGRPYRRLLDGQWGVVDVEDCVAGGRHLAAGGVVDGDRMVIRGGSAGGFTALLALCTGVFAAGTSLYGVTDLAALARDTHKFEARYTDGLVAPWPEAAETYAARSPLGQLDRLATPVLVLQGADDHVVPPAQAEAVVAALAAKGVAHEYLLFPGEGHGFRRAATIVRALEAELAFYTRVLDLTPGGDGPAPPS